MHFVKTILIACVLSLFAPLAMATEQYNRSDLVCNGEKCFDKNGLPASGLVIVYYDSTDKVRSSSVYTNGKKNGPEKIFWENGALGVESLYLNGKKEGIEKVYHEECLSMVFFISMGYKREAKSYLIAMGLF